jgi:peptide-methionine (S)-S-oxide reductase
MGQQNMQTAVFGGGCFWCGEAVFQRLQGVENVTAGYAGGTAKSPTYEQVSAEQTGHAEAIKIEYNPEIISYDTLLSVFFSTHDPTTLNRQGNDVGEQYRSAILYATEEQRQEAEQFIQKLEEDKAFQNSIVTELAPLQDFYEAEDYHQNYYNKNKQAPYCQLVIDPKIQKLQQKYSHLLR